jgi:hypothetical protein
LGLKPKEVRADAGLGEKYERNMIEVLCFDLYGGVYGEQKGEGNENM